MVLLLAKPGEEGSLGHSKNIEIDTSQPYVLNVASSKVNGATLLESSEVALIVSFTACLIAAYGCLFPAKHVRA